MRNGFDGESGNTILYTCTFIVVARFASFGVVRLVGGFEVRALGYGPA